MTTTSRHPTSQHPGCDDPADRPKDPGGECAEVSEPTPPELEEPEKCDPDCECPHPPQTTPSCLDDLIAQQDKEIAEAKRAEAFKADLEAMLAKAKAASLEYTQTKYDKLVEDWLRNDAGLAKLIREVECALPCWKCLIECYICPLLEEVRVREVKLYGDGTLYSDVKTLHDLRYWHERNLDAARRRYDRIRNVLGAWEKPAQTIDKAIADIASFLNPNANLRLEPKLAYDLFLKYVPLHLAIAPPPSSGVSTSIEKKYTEFCQCDVGKPDDCCGPDVGVPSLRQRLIGPQPYLVKPGDFFPIICCLAKERYLPAKDALSGAEAAFGEVDKLIRRTVTEIDERMKSVEKTAKAALPADCDWWESHEPCKPAPTSAR